ncbi:MAG: penicillin-binding protein activator [Alphaproteobacteria bacterium]|nr:penicillin-binding protein activator [Alphaproteobacteria bacterium]
MYINKFFTYLVAMIVLAGCSNKHFMGGNDWTVSEEAFVGRPSNLEHGKYSHMYGSFSEDVQHIAVLLPLTGQSAQVGKTIRTSVETAVLESNSQNISVSFYDTASDIDYAIDTALATNPKVIIGPLFAKDALYLKKSKPSNIPALSFTSDATAVGNGVMTMALMPNNGVEEIVKQIKSDDIKKFIIIAPDTKSGRLMADTAKLAAEIYEMPLIGIFYYTEKDSESIKNASITASMYHARTAAHTRARQVISDVLSTESLSPIEKSNLNTQLEKLEKTETVGTVPYDGILFLGNGDDTKAIASFLRYYNVSARDAAFYGTTMWEGSDIASDYTLSGAKYATLPQTNSVFSATYEQVSGTPANRLASFGYDATNMAINMIYSNKSNAAYLLDPSGYIGTDGLFRLKPNGDNERALRIMQLNGSGTATEIKPAPISFMTPLYNIEQKRISQANAMNMETNGIDPDDYIRLPERFRDKYRSKTIGANIKSETQPVHTNIVTIESDDTTIKSSDFKPVKLESVKRTYIEEYEVEE